MPCSDPTHHHEWPEDGELVIYRCERFCAFCTGDDAKHEWKYPWFLRRHVRAVHGREYPGFWVSDRWNANYEDGAANPSTPKKKGKRLQVDGSDAIKPEPKTTPTKKKNSKTPRSLKTVKSPGTPTRRHGGARSKARFLGSSPAVSTYSDCETVSEEDEYHLMIQQDEGAFLPSPLADRQSSAGPREPEHFADSFHHFRSTVRAPTTPPPELGCYPHDEMSESQVRAMTTVTRTASYEHEHPSNALRYNVDPPLSAGLVPDGAFGRDDRSCDGCDGCHDQCDSGAAFTARTVDDEDRVPFHKQITWRGVLHLAINEAFEEGLKPSEIADVMLEDARMLDCMQEEQDRNDQSFTNSNLQLGGDQHSQLVEASSAGALLEPIETVDARTMSARAPSASYPLELTIKPSTSHFQESDATYASHIAEFLASPLPDSNPNGCRFSDVLLDGLVQRTIRARSYRHPYRGESFSDSYGVPGNGIVDTIDPRLNDPAFYAARTHRS